MTNTVLRWGVIGVGCLTAAVTGPTMAFAQSDPVTNFFSIEPQTYADIPGVPDGEGCVKLCPRDVSPCDPPFFKKVDDRCGQIERHR